MRREHLAYLLGGIAFGLLLGFSLYRGIVAPPEPGRDVAGVPSPAGPLAPTQQGSAQAVMADLEALKARLDRNPDDLAAVVEIGDTLFRLGVWDQAARFYERALQKKADDPDLLTAAGLCYRETGDPETALERFEAAQRADPAHWQSLYNLAVVAGLDLGRVEDAEEAIRRLEAMEPPSSVPLEALRDAVSERRRAGEDPAA